ncbi:MAG: PKD domain-containing protein [Candidatus Eisenbacteria bacterium]
MDWVAVGLLALSLSGFLSACGGGERGEGGADKGLAQGEGPQGAAATEGEVAPVAGEAGPSGARAASSTGNQPPRAGFEVFPLSGYEGITSLRFNATLAKDDSTSNVNLLKRWDYDGDGTWDSAEQRASRVRHTYDQAGTYRPRLLVMDAEGLADSIVGPALEIRKPCPAPDFEMTDLNPNSKSYGEKFSLARLRDHRVIVWYTTPSG